MRKLAEKIAIVALVCTTFVFVLMAVLYATNVIPQKDIADNSVSIVVLSVLSALYLGLSSYLLIVNFSENLHVKRILLFYDSESATSAGSKIVDNIVRGCAKEYPQFKVKRTKIRVDDKMGLIATVYLDATAPEDISSYIPQFRTLLSESFRDALGLKFNSINFEIGKLKKKFVPTSKEIEDARNTAEESVDEVVEDETATTVEETDATVEEGTTAEEEGTTAEETDATVEETVADEEGEAGESTAEDDESADSKEETKV